MTIERWLGYRQISAELLPVGWELKRLRELATDFKAGGSLGLTMANFVDEGTDTYSAEGLSDKTAVEEFIGPAVIVSSIGSKCGKSFFAAGKFTTLANVQIVFTNPDEVARTFFGCWSMTKAFGRVHRRDSHSFDHPTSRNLVYPNHSAMSNGLSVLPLKNWMTPSP